MDHTERAKALLQELARLHVGLAPVDDMVAAIATALGAAVAEEREACARLAEFGAPSPGDTATFTPGAGGSQRIAATIRARSAPDA